MGEQFLTVYAILDERTQSILQSWRSELNNAGIVGTQTDIPFHISLGSYPTDCADELMSAIDTAAKETAPFPIDLPRLNDFGGRVLFAEPEVCPGILQLRKRFDHDYPTQFPYHPHCTLLMDTPERVERARELLQPLFSPLQAQVVSLELGRFFPANILYHTKLTAKEG